MRRTSFLVGFACVALGCGAGNDSSSSFTGGGASSPDGASTTATIGTGGAAASSSTTLITSTTTTTTSTGGAATTGGGTATGTATAAGGAGGAGVTSTASSSASSSTTATTATTGTAGTGGGPTSTLIYANDDTTLVQLDPTNPALPVTVIGDFDCINSSGNTGTDTSMNDIAVDAQGSLWGVSAHAVHPLTIQGSTVHCEQQISIQSTTARFYALTFAPVGVLSTTAEVLVAGDSAGALWSIDAGGNITQHGKFGPVPADDGHGHAYANAGKDWELSGDIVFLANNGSPVGFATVRDCPNPPSTTGCNSVNTLIEIDMTALAASGTQSVTKAVRGEIVTAAGCTDGLNSNYGNMYGIATWDDKVYGFSRTGNLVTMEIADGSACLVGNYASLKWAGAGVTTLATIILPSGG